MYERPRILSAGDCAVVVEYGDEITEECNQRVLGLSSHLENLKMVGIISMIPTYRSLLIKYDPRVIDYNELINSLWDSGSKTGDNKFTPKVIEIPVAYGGEFGPDIQFVADYHKISPEAVIDIHTGGIYRIYMIGFTMGFAYLGGMDEKIATPRLEKPRTEIPAGSVGIAGKQTGIYPITSPGGWQLIGKTPVKLYDPERSKPILLEAGNYIKFVRVTEEEFDEIKKEVENGNFVEKTYEYSLNLS